MFGYEKARLGASSHDIGEHNSEFERVQVRD